MRINMQSLITRAETEPRLHKNTAEITVFVFSAVLHFIILNADKKIIDTFLHSVYYLERIQF